MSRAFLTVAVLGVSGVSIGSAVAQTTFEEIVDLSASFEPANPKPGQTVTFKLTAKIKQPGWIIYPTSQPDENAQSFRTKIYDLKKAPLIFVEDVEDPPGAKEKTLPTSIFPDKIKVKYYDEGTVTFERKAVVLPTAKPGETEVLVRFFIQAVGDDRAIPADFNLRLKGMPVKITIAEGSVPVADEYQDVVAEELRKRGHR